MSASVPIDNHPDPYAFTAGATHAFPCMTGRLPLYLKPGPGPVQILDTNGAVLVELDIDTDHHAYTVKLGAGVELRGPAMVRNVTGL